MEQNELLQYAADVLERLGVRYMIVGSFGSGAYGERRFTHDIDIVAELKRSHVPGLLAAFPVPKYSISEDAIREAISSRFQFNIIDNNTCVKIDVMMPRRDDWGRTQLDRREQIPMHPGRLVYAASREDVIVGKLVYYTEGQSDKQLQDIKG